MTNTDEKYTLSEQTIRSLDHLGTLLYSEDIEQVRKGIEIVNKTEGEPLIRLYRGALHRFTKPVAEIEDPANDIEIRQNTNIIAINSFLAGNDLMIEMVIDRYARTSPNVIQGLLATAVMQYEGLERQH